MSTRRLLAVVVLVPLLAALALWAFAWPAARTAPRDLPLGVAGPAAATAQVEKQVRQHEGAFEIHRYADERAARAAIEDRTVYGAVVVTAQGPELLTASAASPVVAQLLQQAVTRQAAAGGAEVRTVDVVPAPVSDPRGAALSSSVLPLALSGIIAGAVVTLLKLRGLRAVTALVLSAALVGAVAAALADCWLGVLAGNWWAEAGTLALATLAVSAAVAGLAALVGPAGIGVVAFLVMFLGNPFSGASSAPQLLPDPVGTVGQWLPPGASATLLRSVAFFDGAAATGPLLTLTWWAALGLGAVVLGNALPSRARGTTSPTDEPALAPVG
ncbi:VIT1/CCC1 family predicted Fe2+/Mn2+ transporter [Streptomyces sp. SAI-133]|uniref:ABC transporter permease n=1 Tax=unclassified Streptomyces TaxID=2593676 RepID=UPI002473C05F|nr:ABC transporter permease [Streptomyces sp. SAI-133]MDH6583062.1 VIT1/CCC1 family predicted Fe2+/Mn2+ transporter [Streptomyces sp. SAI-133]